MIGGAGSFSMNARPALAVRPDQVRAGVGIALALGLAIQLGRLVLIAVAPADSAMIPAARATPAPADHSVFQRFDAFFPAGGTRVPAGAGASGHGQLRLYGLRSDGAGGGSAIIGLADGRQVSVGVGEAVEPGLVLRSVGPDHVVLAQGASVSRLAFSETPTGAVPVRSPSAGPGTVALTPAPAASGDRTPDEPDPV